MKDLTSWNALTNHTSPSHSHSHSHDTRLHKAIYTRCLASVGPPQFSSHGEMPTAAASTPENPEAQNIGLLRVLSLSLYHRHCVHSPHARTHGHVTVHTDKQCALKCNTHEKKQKYEYKDKCNLSI
jgi:hypothetical protein